MEDGPVDLVQPRGQGVLVALAGEHAANGGGQRCPVLALGELGEVRLQALGGSLVPLARGDDGVYGRLPLRQMPLDGVGELGGECEHLGQGLSPVGVR